MANETIAELIKSFGLSEGVLCKARDGLIRKEVLVEERVTVNGKGRFRKGFYLSESFKDILNFWIEGRSGENELLISNHVLVDQFLFDERSFLFEIEDHSEQDGADAAIRFPKPTEKINKLKPVTKVFLALLFANADERGVVDSMGGADIRRATLMTRDRLQSQLEKIKDLGLIISHVKGLTSGKLFGVVKAVYVLNLGWEGFSRPKKPYLILFFSAIDGLKSLPQEADAIYRQAREVYERGRVEVDYMSNGVLAVSDGVEYVPPNKETYPNIADVGVRGHINNGIKKKESALCYPLFKSTYDLAGLFIEDSSLDLPSVLQWKLENIALNMLLIHGRKRNDEFWRNRDESVLTLIDNELISQFKAEFGLSVKKKSNNQDDNAKDLMVDVICFFSYQIAKYLRTFLINVSDAINGIEQNELSFFLVPKQKDKDLMSFCLMVYSKNVDYCDQTNVIVCGESRLPKTYNSIRDVSDELLNKYGLENCC